MKKIKACLIIFFLTGVSAVSFSQMPGSQDQFKNRVTPFKIKIAQSVLDDLQERLRQTRWTDEPAKAGWGYGVDPTYLRELVTYWKTKYDWRKQEAALNTFPQFKTEIDGITIHFIYVKGKGRNPKPLVLTHGWPDSFYRFYKVIPMLTDPAGYGGDPDKSFDVVVPSLPAFGFSDRQTATSEKTADLLEKLMTEVLGYEEFFAAGSDIGTAITKNLAIKYPRIVKAIHLTGVGNPNGTEDPLKMSPDEREFVKAIQRWSANEGAFFLLQSTKPQTLGYGLNDSPVALAAWILEKFYAWSDNKGNIENSFSKDELLTNIMIYWVTQTINSSIRFYFEASHVPPGPNGTSSSQYVEVPTAVAVFPADVPARVPREWAEKMVNVKRFTKMPRGGHFAALEEPKLWVEDITNFFYSSDVLKITGATN